MAIDYIRLDTAPLYQQDAGSEKILNLLWGDRVETLPGGAARTKVKARGKTGFVNNDALGGQSLLEVYFIDVGQGDGVLIRMPDHRHIMIDGGYNRAKQPTRKNAADFVDWKFHKDYGLDRISLDAMLVSHCDADHYGGLWDLCNVAEISELDAADVRVEHFYHAGIGWWVNPANNQRWLGEKTADGEFFTQLMGDRAQVLAALQPGAQPRLQGEWAQFVQSMTDTKRGDDTPTPIKRLSHMDQFVPGFDGAGGQPALKILAPVEFDENGAPAIRRFGATDSWNTNGNSLLLRLDYGRARILLTGDLNSKSQRALLTDYAGERQEFECDVAKACHHGSDDVSYEFLAAMRPAVTIISSGDNEGHDHPRPAVVAASATTGYLIIENDEIVTPLVYATEMARSVSFGRPVKLTIPFPADPPTNPPTTSPKEVAGELLDKTSVEYEETKAGDLHPRKRTRSMKDRLIVAGLVYGLVNVRTDGDRILCATMNEKDYSWNIRAFQSRF